MDQMPSSAVSTMLRYFSSLAASSQSAASRALKSTSRQNISRRPRASSSITWLEWTGTAEPSLRLSVSSPAGMLRPRSSQSVTAATTASRMAGGMISSSSCRPMASVRL